MPQHITVLKYDPKWKQDYQDEQKKIEDILKENALVIYHIGSTSVPGLAAKPIIDIMVAVRSLEKVDAAADAFSALGYEFLGEFGIAGRRYLRKGGDERTHQIHIFQADDWNNIGRHLAFRQYLSTHEREREEYAKLKRELAQQFPYDIEGYCDGKEAFVRAVEAQALSCYDDTWDRLYLAARKVQGNREISSTVEAGGVSAALLTEAGNIYVGVCIDTACSLGMCAERNAIVKIVAVMGNGKVGMPCGVCRELMMQLDPKAGETEILCDYETKQVVKLRELLPNWWR